MKSGLVNRLMTQKQRQWTFEFQLHDKLINDANPPKYGYFDALYIVSLQQMLIALEMLRN